jgi:hypothetical protein
LDTIAGYREALVREGTVSAGESSILIVVGREDTGDLEAQVRGSRHAWDTRLISVDALVELLRLKENLEEPGVVRKIRSILTPQEYTKVDGIISTVFATAEEVRHGDEPSEDEDDDEQDAPVRSSGPRFIPAAFHEACIVRIGSRLGLSLLKQSRATYRSADGSVGLICSVSRQHGSPAAPTFWYAFHPHQRQTLLGVDRGFVAFGCGSAEAILLVPFADFEPWLDGMNITEKADRRYWHVSIFHEAGKFVLHRKKGYDRIDLSRYLLA